MANETIERKPSKQYMNEVLQTLDISKQRPPNNSVNLEKLIRLHQIASKFP